MADGVDLGPLVRAINNVGDHVRHVGEQVHAVDHKVIEIKSDVDSIEARLQTLSTQFNDYLKRYEMATELQLAETKLIKVRQELETKFGHYSEVRRRTTGVLQATDVGIVRQETITTVTEELMLAAPRYWLAPCLVAVAAWLADNKDVAEKALQESSRRDPYKTSLFFALVGRRLGRSQMRGAWLERYFGLLDPLALDRDTIVLIDALAGGVFGAESRSLCSTSLQYWIELLADRPGFVEAQRDQ